MFDLSAAEPYIIAFLLQVGAVVLGKIATTIATNYYRHQVENKTVSIQFSQIVPVGTKYKDFLATDYDTKHIAWVFSWGRELVLVVGGPIAILIPTIAFIDLTPVTKGIIFVVTVIVFGFLWNFARKKGPYDYAEFFWSWVPVPLISAVMLVINSGMVALAGFRVIKHYH